MTTVPLVYILLFLYTFAQVRSFDLEYGDIGYNSYKDQEIPEGFLNIQCEVNRGTITDAIKPLSTGNYVNSISVRNCVPPPTSYAKEFQALNINTTNIETLNLIFDEEAPLPSGDYMVGLNITTLKLDRDNTNNGIKDILQNIKNFLDPLSNLRTLRTSIRIPRIPTTMQLKELLLFDDASIGDWGQCQHLERLHTWGEKRLPRWPKKCSKLKDLHISEMPLEIYNSLANMYPVAPNLSNLTLTSNLLYLMPNKFLSAARQLQHLDLSENNFYDKAFLEFPIMDHLTFLSVNQNLLTGSFLGYVVPRLPALRRLYMKEEYDFYSYCVDNHNLHKGIEYLKQSYVEEISFWKTYIHLDCFFNGHFKNLSMLDMTYTASPELHLMRLPTSGAENLTIKYSDETRDHHFSEIYFSEMDYQELQKRNASLNNGTHYSRWIVLTTYINCNCKNSWLARALRDFPNLISMPDLRCDHKDGINVLEESLDKMECKIWSEQHLRSCIFIKLWREEAIDARCKNGTVPWTKNIRNLDVSNSGLTTFFTDLPLTVQMVDYRNNRLSSADQVAMDTMFLNGRRVWLGNNEIVCDCDNSALLDGIQKHWKQVNDYDDLTCIGTGQPISSVLTTELCRTTLKITIEIISILFGLILILALLCRIYRQKIRIFLYSKGCCLNCLRKNELVDKPYDAFISYAHGDDDFVKEVLVPGLENSPEKFRLCVHYRDWDVGGWIPDQIMNSVTHSKRTIIVLSKNFITSSWSALEFRYAQANTSVDDLSRVLIVILDDILDKNLNPELQNYLNFNTYLRYDDPWFWERLRYAMPHKTKDARPGKNDTGPERSYPGVDHPQELINMVMLMESNAAFNNVSS